MASTEGRSAIGAKISERGQGDRAGRASGRPCAVGSRNWSQARPFRLCGTTPFTLRFIGFLCSVSRPVCANLKNGKAALCRFLFDVVSIAHGKCVNSIIGKVDWVVYRPSEIKKYFG